MAQLGKYSTDRDNILHYMATCDWANGSFGDVDSPTGYVWRMSNTWDEVKPNNMEITSLLEDQIALYDIVDGPEFRKTLVGHFLIQEDSNGLVHVLEFATGGELDAIYSELAKEYDSWDAQGEY